MEDEARTYQDINKWDLPPPTKMGRKYRCDDGMVSLFEIYSFSRVSWVVGQVPFGDVLAKVPTMEDVYHLMRSS